VGSRTVSTGGAGGAPRAASQIDRVWPRVAAFYRDRLQESGIVGSSVFVVKDGVVVARAWEGYQDLDRRRPVDDETIYHWASITKTLTGIAILQLRDRGLLTLDDPVVRYVPELRQVHNPFGDMSQVTIRHLMTHSAGFRAATWPWGGDQPWHPFEPTRWGQVVAMFPYTELQFRPGTKYSYSNPGVIFLGRIIELLSGDDYEVYITKNILMPLGMSRSFFDRAPYHLLRHRSHSYFRTDEGLKEGRFDFDTGITVSNGGLNAPLGDMAKYLAFLIGDEPPLSAPGPDTGRSQQEANHDINDSVLRRASLDEMFTRQIRAADGEGGSGPDVWAGLSCFIEHHQGLELVGHSGDQNGFISHLYLHPASKAGYVVSFNTDVSSKSDPRRSTRAVDNDLRTILIREIFSTLMPKASTAGKPRM
jgi:CubicO group peptidase (beta-lactamase class C family)